MSTNLNEFRTLPLAAITFSTTTAQVERRQHFDKGQMAELADSIKSHGLVQPILVRPRFKDDHGDLNQWEVVAGERRAIAAKQAGLKEIQATVRELTDEQVLELQLIENLQRADLHELAEAEGYEALQKLGHSVDDMAAKVGKSRGTVYARMKLLALLPEARKAYYDGKLSASTALYIARVPNQLQKQALKEVTELRGWGDEKAPMSSRQVQKHIHDNYMLRLSDAGFKTEDPSLIPVAGACGACPKRTGNQPELFGDVKGSDVCTDPICFKAKIRAHAERVMATAEASGQTVLTGPAAKKVAKYGVDSGLEGFVRLDKHDYHGSGNKTYRQLLGKAYVPTLLQDPDTGKMIEIASDRDVEKARGKSPSKADNSYRNSQRAEQKKREFELLYRRTLFLAIHAKKSDEAMPTLHDACIEFFKSLSADTQQLLAKALGWDLKTKGAQGNYSRHIEPKPFIDGMTLPDLYKLLRDLTLAGELGFFTYGSDKTTPRMTAAAKACGVNPAKIRTELQAAEKAKAAPKESKKPRAKK